MGFLYSDFKSFSPKVPTVNLIAVHVCKVLKTLKLNFHKTMAHNWLPFMKVMKLEPYGYKDKVTYQGYQPIIKGSDHCVVNFLV